MADIQYLNYGDLQIELLALLNNLANNVQSYVESQSWSKSRKEKFMSAYQDIMNRGLLGASNASGLWVLNVKGDDFGFDAMDKKSREMYQEAAYFIQQQMSSLPTRTSLEEDEEKKKKELPLFDNKYFTTNFLNQLSKDWFGGRSFDTKSDWNSLDVRGENGRRGRKVRADRLARSLENYVNSLDETKLNFEGSPFNDLNDFRTRVNKAVTALRTDSPDDDLDALNRIGLRASDYFNDGSGDIYVTDREGNPITYGLYYDAQSKLLEEERQAKLKAEQDAFNLKRGVILPIGGIHGTDARTNPEGYRDFIAKTYGTGEAGYNKINGVILSLLNKGLGMTASDKKLLGNFLYYIRQNNPAYQDSGVSDEEYAELMKHNSLKGKRQLDFIRFPWKVNGLDIYGDNQGNIYYVKNDRTASNGVIENPRLKFDREKVNQYKKQFLQGITEEDKKLAERLKASNRHIFEYSRNQDGSINVLDSMKNAGIDSLRLLALVEDIGSGIAAFVPGYGTAISAGLSLDSLVKEGIADAVDPSVSWGDFFKNLGINFGTGLLGLIPGGKVFKLGKWGKVLAKWAPSILGLGLSIGSGVLNSSETKRVWTKIMNGEDITVDDSKVILSSVAALTGIMRSGRGIHDTRKFGPLLGGTTKKSYIKTTKGKVNASLEQVNELNRIGITKGNDEANIYLNKHIVGNENAGHRVTVDFSTNKINNSRLNPIRRFTSPTVKLLHEYINTGTNSNYSEFRRILDAEFRKKHPGLFGLKLDGTIPTTYLLYTKPNFSNLGIGSALRKIIDPSYDPKNKYNSTPTTQKLSTNTSTTSNIPHSRNEIRREYKNVVERGNFSKNTLQEGEYKVGNFNIKVGRNNKGEWKIHTDAYSSNAHGPRSESPTMKPLLGKFNSLKKVQKEIAKIIKESRRRANLPDALGKRAGINHKEIGKLLLELKSKGWLKQGGRIDKLKIQKYKDFINK